MSDHQDISLFWTLLVVGEGYAAATDRPLQQALGAKVETLKSPNVSLTGNPEEHAQRIEDAASLVTIEADYFLTKTGRRGTGNYFLHYRLLRHRLDYHIEVDIYESALYPPSG